MDLIPVNSPPRAGVAARFMPHFVFDETLQPLPRCLVGGQKFVPDGLYFFILGYLFFALFIEQPELERFFIVTV